MKFVFYLIITIIAITSGVVVFYLSSSEPVATAPAVTTIKNEVEIKTADVLVAKVNIPIGSIVDQSMVDVQPWPENLVVDNFILGDKAGQEVVGKIVRSAISAREPFIKSKLANPNDPGFLAATLPPGFRAVTIATDTVSGIAGFVFPGDRIDLLFTHRSIGSDGMSGTPNIVEVLAANVKVLAINVREPNSAASPQISPSSITVEASDELAQRIRLAEKNGTLSLSLRSIHDDSTTSPDPTDLSNLSKANISSRNATTSTVIVRGPGNAGGKISFSDSANETNTIGSSMPQNQNNNVSVGQPVSN